MIVCSEIRNYTYLISGLQKLFFHCLYSHKELNKKSTTDTVDGKNGSVFGESDAQINVISDGIPSTILAISTSCTIRFQ